MKSVTIMAHEFDCLPGHVVVTARGNGSNARVATAKAFKSLYKAPELKRRHLKSFKATVVIETREKGE